MLRLTLFYCFISLLFSCQEKQDAHDAEHETTKDEAPAKNTKPNVVIILADDLGYGDLSCYNADSKIPTPELDKMAKAGMRFTDAHTPSSVCTPTRYGLLTGSYCWRSDLKRGVLQPYDLPLIPDSVETIAEVFKQGGYNTAIIGKWHLGFDWNVEPGVEKNWAINKNRKGRGVVIENGIPGGPLDAGFDYHFGHDAPNFPPFCFWENGQILGPKEFSPKPDSIYGDPGPWQKGWELVDIMPELEKRSLAYLEERKQAGKPFFLYLSLTAPHVPIVPEEEVDGKSEAGAYGDFVYQCDQLVGRVRAKLQALGMAENTVLVFTSDNGSPGRTEDPDLNGKYTAGSGSIIEKYGHLPNGKLKGLKGDFWEGGHRVPMIVEWPAKVQANTQNDQLACLTDWMSLAYAANGKALPQDQAHDAYDLLPSLEDPNQSIRPHIVHHSARGDFGIRKGNWKLLLGQDGGAGYSKYYYGDSAKSEHEYQLYNLAEDLAETKNRYPEQPEKVEELRALLKKCQNDGRSRW